MAGAMRIEVEGVEIHPDQVNRTQGWRVAGEKLRAQQQQGQHNIAANAQSSKPNTEADLSRRPATNFKSKLLKAARMPELPKEHIKIIMRPRGGLDVSEVSRFEVSRAIAVAANIGGEKAKNDVICPNKQQNIVIVSTPKRENADRYAVVRKLTIYGVEHDVSAYESAPHGTVKGVIRGVPLTDTAQEINDYVVHEYNPTALQASRIGTTMSVVIAFSGPKVPNYVKYGNLLVECSLYRKQIDLCYQCGRLGHRMDVCPNPTNKICRGCGIENPEENHACTPKCSLCGGDHLTADKVCKARYKTPYVVRKRRWERQRLAREESFTTTQPRQEIPAAPESSPPLRERQSRRSLSRGRERKRSNSRASRPGSRTSSPGAETKTRSSTPKGIAGKQVGWAIGSSVAHSNDTEFPPLTPSSPSNECKECSELKKECAELKRMIATQNQQIKVLLERMGERDRTETSEDNTKRKVAKRDTHPEVQPGEAMEENSATPPSTAPSPTSQQLEPTLETIMSMLSQISSQQTQTNSQVAQVANQVGLLTEQTGNVTTRLDNLEAKYNQLSARMTAFDAKLKHASLVSKKSLKSAFQNRPHHGDNPATDYTSQDQED